MIKAEIDQPKLERSLKRFGNQLGETNAQAVIRWSVQTCRELAMETQVWGKVKTKAKQEGAIIGDAYNVLIVVDKLKKNKIGTGYRATNQGAEFGVKAENVLQDEKAVNDWIEMNRTRRGGRTAKLPIHERRTCSRAIFNKAMVIRKAKAGMAKGAWLGAGNEIARAQTGAHKMSIGRNFLNYTQKHSAWGDARKPSNGWKPVAGVTNKLAYSGKNNVLARSGISRAIKYGLSKTVRYYQATIRAIDKKDKP